ncbi:MAG: DEAD/DEAH box helicase family protein [Methylococcaceae bacterium]|jgi:type I restriction enzyme R subunit
MSSRHFEFLDGEWPQLHESARRAEGVANIDPRTSIFYARRTLELAVAWLYTYDRSLRLPYQDNLSALIHEPTFRSVVGDALFTKARLIKDLGNLAVHSTRPVSVNDAVVATRELFHFCYWLARTYGQRSRPDPSLRFSADQLPKAAQPKVPLEQLRALETQLHEKDEKLSELLSTQAALDEELQRLRAEVAAAKQANTAQPDTHDYSEAETRDYFIDLLLKEAGWGLDEHKNMEVEVTGMPNPTGTGFVDYVEWADDGKPLALCEAKHTKKSPMVGQQQGKLYADCLQAMYGQRPVIFLSNGYQHWLWDDLSHPPRAVQGFYKRDELQLLIQRRSSRRPLAMATINETIVERYYQKRAIRRVLESFERDHLRKALLVMATGSGKTRTVIALCDLLMRCNWAKRILFLADRKALVRQAVNAFKQHLPDGSPVNLVTDKHGHGRVFVSTYQTMMGLIDAEKGDEKLFGVGHFDLIVIDEAHRSVYQKFRAIFDYFDARLVGLTATPKDEIDKNTYSLFDLESGVPTDVYGLDEAVADNYLVPPVALSVPLKFQRQGIKYDDLSDEEKEQWDALEWNEDGTTPTEVDAAALNQWLFNTDTVDKVLAHVMTNGLKVEGGDTLGKTIVFAKNQAHAEFIAERFDRNFPQYKGHFARVITHKTVFSDTLIDDFSNPNKLPQIAISVDMLDTGIDVPEVVNLVFFKPVRSKTKFWQMIGRGTRLCSDLFGPGQHKTEFYVFDYCQNLEYFSQPGAGAEGSLTEALSTRLFKARLDLIQLLSAHGQEQPAEQHELRQDIIQLLHDRVAAMNVHNFVVRPRRQSVEKFAKAEAWQALSADDFGELSDHAADLPTELIDNDEDAKRFDLLMLRTQLAVMKATPDFNALKERIQKIAALLDEQANIPAVKAHLTLIQDLMSEEWWEGVTTPMLEAVRKQLRSLIKLIPKGQRVVVYTDFEDELIDNPTIIALPDVTVGLDLAKFRQKARQYLLQHEDHLSLQRLRRGQPITAMDLEALEEMLIAAGGSKELIGKAAEQAHGLGIFIRSLIGMERDAAMALFNEFLTGGNPSANQIEFVKLIVEELTRSGVMEPSRLFELPFTNLSAMGPLGLFPQAKVDKLVETLIEIRQRAAA